MIFPLIALSYTVLVKHDLHRLKRVFKDDEQYPISETKKIRHVYNFCGGHNR